MKEAIVIGAGAGGCAAARELAGSFHVTLLEQGGQFHPFDKKLASFERLRMAGLFLDARMIQALFADMRIGMMDSMPLVWGRGMGGTTNLATCNAIRYDKALAQLGVNLDDEFSELKKLVPQTTEHRARWSKLTRDIYHAFAEEGLDPAPMPKMIDAKRCANCGQCALGCRFNAKWTADRLLDTVDPYDINVLTGYKALRLEIYNNQVKGVVCKHNRKNELLTADLVVIAAGGVGTPRILQASGISCQHTFFVDPVLCVAAPWEGANMQRELPMPFVSQRDGYILSPYFDYLSFFFDKEWRMPAGDIFSLMVKFADDENGFVAPHRISKSLTNHDYETAAHGVEDCMRIMNRMGIHESETFFGMLNAGHPGGSLPLTFAEAESLHNPTLPANAYVADSSLFPKSMGNPPILTIMALAKKVAKTAAEACC